MNPTSKLDLHPEAESLNAFAEQALPEQERAQILAHLAACSRCRQVVYLAQEAAELETMPASVATARPAVQRAPWLSNLWLTWVPAGALAAMVGLAVYVHVRRTETGSEMARATPQSEQSALTPAVQEQANTGVAAAPASAKRSAGNMHSATAQMPSELLPAEAADESAPAASPPSAAVGAIGLSHVERAEPKAAPGGSGQGFATQEAGVQAKAETAVEAWKQQHLASALSSTAAAARTEQARLNNVASHAQTGQFDSLAGSAPPSALQPAPSASFDNAGGQTAPGIFVARKAIVTALPSGLAAVSTATARQRTLAIDQAGALFLSEDAGSHWEPVARQWAGRAVRVRYRPALHGNAAAEFEISNDQGTVWVSADGRTWQAQ
jgi:hypothetical protein